MKKMMELAAFAGQPQAYDSFIKAYLSELPDFQRTPTDLNDLLIKFHSLECLGMLKYEFAKIDDIKIGVVLIGQNLPIGVLIPKYKGEYTEISLAYIYPQFRRKGIMHSLVSRILNRYSGLIGWEIEQRNIASQLFFQKLAEEKKYSLFHQTIVINSEGLDVRTKYDFYLSPKKGIRHEQKAV